MINKTEEWLYKKAKEVDSELELQDLYTSKFSFGGRWVMDLLEEYHNEQLTLTDVSQQRELLIAYEIESKKPYKMSREIAEAKVTMIMKAINCG